MPRFAANLSMLYTEHAFLDRFAAAAQDGFGAVEFLFPYAFPADLLQQQAQALDLLAEELRLAQNALGEITGQFSADDLLGVIFSKFCIGK